MKITVALNSEAATSGEIQNLGDLVKDDEVRVLKIFGRGRFANIEASQDAYIRLKTRIGHVCVFTPALKAKPF
ncbi:hypothetical protein [Marivita hallyeonensis]|uniref:Uncharacterized protein n=1 Tax=Marivita hallyeonensis TaxID=996342 RepID=A0A1M5T8R0_9RHOB|nr:hypothetical protein [Marivita hallyeonensis]SHH47157.1 hypothetical protein SAMN05443551_2131 [Marivita hallyeonensis]